MDSSETLDSDDSQINLLILGSGGFAQAMESEIRVCTCIYVYITFLCSLSLVTDYTVSS